MTFLHSTAEGRTQLLFAFAALTLLIGCGRSAIDKALESDARGYFCPACKLKFYTEYKVIADVCPQCKSYDIQEVAGFECNRDSHTTLAPRGQRVVPCGKCGQAATGLRLPNESDLKTWGATRKTKAEVSPK